MYGILSPDILCPDIDQDDITSDLTDTAAWNDVFIVASQQAEAFGRTWNDQAQDTAGFFIKNQVTDMP